MPHDLEDEKVHTAVSFVVPVKNVLSAFGLNVCVEIHCVPCTVVPTKAVVPDAACALSARPGNSQGGQLALRGLQLGGEEISQHTKTT